MTKTEFKGQSVEELRAALLDLFEDEDGALADATKAQLTEFTDENWEYINSVLNPEEPDGEEAPEGLDLESTGAPITEGEGPQEPFEVEVLETTVNLGTDLYTGRPPL